MLFNLIYVLMINVCYYFIDKEDDVMSVHYKINKYRLNFTDYITVYNESFLYI
jgi:hypothetical protein